MGDFDRTIDFGPDASIQAAAYVQVKRGNSSVDREVTADFDYVDLLDGVGDIEIDGVGHSLIFGHGTTVPSGSTYRLRASASADLAVTIYNVNRGDR